MRGLVLLGATMMNKGEVVMKLRGVLKTLVQVAVLACGLLGMTKPGYAADVTLAQNGVTSSVLAAAPQTMEPDKTPPATASDAETQAETHRRRLRESVKDLAHYMQRI